MSKRLRLLFTALYSRTKLTADLKSRSAVYAVNLNSCLRHSLTLTSIIIISLITSSVTAIGAPGAGDLTEVMAEDDGESDVFDIEEVVSISETGISENALYADSETEEETEEKKIPEDAKSVTVTSADNLYSYGSGYYFGFALTLPDEITKDFSEDYDEKREQLSEEVSCWGTDILVRVDEGDVLELTGVKITSSSEYATTAELFFTAGYLPDSITAGTHNVTIAASRTKSSTTTWYAGTLKTDFIKQGIKAQEYDKTLYGRDIEYFSSNSGGRILSPYIAMVVEDTTDTVTACKLVKSGTTETVATTAGAKNYSVKTSYDPHYIGGADDLSNYLSGIYVLNAELEDFSISSDITEGWYDVIVETTKGITATYKAAYYGTQKTIIYNIEGSYSDFGEAMPWFDLRSGDSVCSVVYGVNIDEDHGYPIYYHKNVQLTEYEKGNSEDFGPYVKRFILKKKSGTNWDSVSVTDRNDHLYTDLTAGFYYGSNVLDLRSTAKNPGFYKDNSADFSAAAILSSSTVPRYWSNISGKKWEIRELSTVKRITGGSSLKSGVTLNSQIPEADRSKLRAGNTYRLAVYTDGSVQPGYDWTYYYVNGFTGGTPSPVPEPDPSETTVMLDRKSITLDIGETVKINATIMLPSYTGSTLSWSTSDASTAKVQTYGSGGRTALITAIASGEAKITVTEEGGAYDVCTVTVLEDDAGKNGDVKKLTDGDVWIASISDQIYTGATIIPKVHVYHGTRLLCEGKDYTVLFKNNIKIASIYDLKPPTAIVKFKGNYNGTLTADFSIVESGEPIADDALPLSTVASIKKLKLPSKPYTGSAITQSVYLDDIAASNYRISYINNINAGTATMVFTGRGKYTGCVKKSFKINRKSLGGAVTSTDLSAVPYAKGGSKPEPVISLDGRVLENGIDYTLSYKGGAGADKYGTIKVNGRGNYSGTREFTFYVAKQKLSGMTILMSDKVESVKVTGWISAPSITDLNGKKLVSGKDYKKPSYEDYVYDGKSSGKLPVAGQTVKLPLTGLGNYEGNVPVAYRIVSPGRDISKAKVKVSDQTFTGKETVLDSDDFSSFALGQTTLKLGQEFEIVSYRNNLNKGTATAVVRGIGNYGGIKTVSFRIEPREV